MTAIQKTRSRRHQTTAGYRRSCIVWPLSSANPRRLPTSSSRLLLMQSAELLPAVTDALTRNARISQPKRPTKAVCLCERLMVRSHGTHNSLILAARCISHTFTAISYVYMLQAKCEYGGHGHCKYRGVELCWIFKWFAAVSEYCYRKASLTRSTTVFLLSCIFLQLNIIKE